MLWGHPPWVSIASRPEKENSLLPVDFRSGEILTVGVGTPAFVTPASAADNPGVPRMSAKDVRKFGQTNNKSWNYFKKLNKFTGF
jgi:hypothetical protein